MPRNPPSKEFYKVQNENCFTFPFTFCASLVKIYNNKRIFPLMTMEGDCTDSFTDPAALSGLLIAGMGDGASTLHAHGRRFLSRRLFDESR